ncbi:hypothetical protein [Vibrio owensii]|uniref:hypothetical protein n=1 Tax=Vibrio owensii TaxID=696485 RepID=UPI0018F14A9D|nr:hypothetical protein [Vibrio owensii]
MFDITACLSFEEVDTFIRSKYRHDRLYGRTSNNGWDDNYGKRIVENYLNTLNADVDDPHIIISKHEAASGIQGIYRRSDILKHFYATAEQSQLRKLSAKAVLAIRKLDFKLEEGKSNPYKLRIFSCLNVRRNLIRNRLANL